MTSLRRPGRRTATAIGIGIAACILLHAPAWAMGGAEHSCERAAVAAEQRYDLPRGLLLAIGKVEAGRPVQTTGLVEPWPWSVDASHQSLAFSSKAAAIAWVRAAQAEGQSSIDVGCFQINLYFHPSAFGDLDDAFDPAHNADFAARFLSRLHARFGDWGQATGAYHSQTVGLAEHYRQRVALAFEGESGPASPKTMPAEQTLSQMQRAWRATLPPDSDDPPLFAAAPGGASPPSPAMLSYLPVRARPASRGISVASVRDSIWKGR